MVDTNFFAQINGSGTNGGSRLLGLSSGINSQEIINSLVAARRQPAVQLENRIAQNDARLSAFAELKTLISGFKSGLEGLRGRAGFGLSSVFDQKVSFVQSQAAATAAPGHVVSAADSILGAAVSTDAQPGVHRVEVVQIAKTHQIRTGVATATNTALSGQGFTTGTFTLNGTTINLDADDSLLDLRDKINIAGAGVTASIVSASPTEHFLVLSADETGLANAIDLAGGNAVTDSLGLTNAGAIQNELQAAQDAIIRVDNLGVDIVRTTNTFDDVIEGITFDLFKAEPDTEVIIEVENDLGAVKQSVIDFVDAFNALKDFADEQRLEIVRTEGGEAEFGPLAFDGTLRALVGQLNQLVGQTIAGQPDGYATLGQVGVEFTSDFRLEIDDDTLDNRLLTDLDTFRDLFEFNFTSSDSRVRLASFDRNVVGATDGSGNPQPFYLNVGATDADGNVLSANFQATAGAGAGGAADGSATVNGQLIRGLEGTNGYGLSLFFDSAPSDPGADDIEITVTRGIADRLFFALDRFVGLGGQGEIADNERLIAQQSENFSQRILDIDARVELFRQRQVARFAALERAVLQANSLQESITQGFDSLNGRDN